MRNNVCAFLFFVLAAILLPAQRGWSWVETGHKIVGLIAWEDLTPKTRSAVTELLKKHARYEKDLLIGLPEDSTPQETDRFAFATAGAWPDMVRSQSNPMHNTYNHPNWHYIDIPYVLDGVTVPASQESGQGPKNVVEALAKCTAELKDDKTPAEEKAVDICWIDHLVGDIHQPLHAISMYSKNFPSGDRGGNEQEVLRDPPYANSRQNLHLIWDQLPGTFKTIQLDGYQAQGLRSDPQYSRERLKTLLDVTDPAMWANESHELAVKVVYREGTLNTAIVQKDRQPGAANNALPPGLPADYLAKAEPVAMSRVVLAGYRLADLLNAVFDAKP